MANKKSSKKTTTKGKRKVQAVAPNEQTASKKAASTAVASSKEKQSTAPTTPTQKSRSSQMDTPAHLPFERMNYILLVVGVLMIGFGFFLMSLDGFVDATQFSVSLYIAPVVVVAGFLEIIYAIMYKPKRISSPDNS